MEAINDTISIISFNLSFSQEKDLISLKTVSLSNLFSKTAEKKSIEKQNETTSRIKIIIEN